MAHPLPGTMQVYFSADWAALVETSFRNFLSEVVSRLPLPAVLRFNADRRQRLALQAAVERLTLEAAARAGGQPASAPPPDAARGARGAAAGSGAAAPVDAAPAAPGGAAGAQQGPDAAAQKGRPTGDAAPEAGGASSDGWSAHGAEGQSSRVADARAVPAATAAEGGSAHGAPLPLEWQPPAAALSQPPMSHPLGPPSPERDGVGRRLRLVAASLEVSTGGNPCLSHCHPPLVALCPCWGNTTQRKRGGSLACMLCTKARLQNCWVNGWVRWLGSGHSLRSQRPVSEGSRQGLRSPARRPIGIRRCSR
jgi:hypothetical protein